MSTNCTTSLRLPKELKSKVDDIATFYERKPNWLMVKAIELLVEREMAEIEWLKDLEKEARQARTEGKMVDGLAACDLMDKHIAETRVNGKS